MLRKVRDKTNPIKIFLFSSFVICWFSISTSYNDLLVFDGKKIILKDIINFLRHGLVYLCFLILIFILNFLRKDINFKQNWIFYFFSIYFLFQVPGLIYTNNNLTNISFIISSLTSIFTIALINNYFHLNEKKIIFLFSCAILIFVYLITFIPLLLDFLRGSHKFYGMYENYPVFFDKISPRSSGLSRTALIIFIFINIIESSFLKKRSIFMNLIKIFLIISIILMQSRTIIFLLIATLLIILIHNEKLKFSTIVKFFSIYFFIPILLSFLLFQYNTYGWSTKKMENMKNSSVLEIIKSENYKDYKNLRNFIKDDISSGRFGDWKEITKVFYEKNFFEKELYFGYGAQGDRYIIDQSASNSFFYALASSGLIGLALFLVFSLVVGIKALIQILFYFRTNKVNFFYSLILLLLSMRGILESSYAVFGLDFLIFLTSLSFIEDDKIKIKNIKNKYFKW